MRQVATAKGSGQLQKAFCPGRAPVPPLPGAGGSGVGRGLTPPARGSPLWSLWGAGRGSRGGSRVGSPLLSFVFLTSVRVFLLPSYGTKA